MPLHQSGQRLKTCPRSAGDTKKTPFFIPPVFYVSLTLGPHYCGGFLFVLCVMLFDDAS